MAKTRAVVYFTLPQKNTTDWTIKKTKNQKNPKTTTTTTTPFFFSVLEIEKFKVEEPASGKGLFSTSSHGGRWEF